MALEETAAGGSPFLFSSATKAWTPGVIFRDPEMVRSFASSVVEPFQLGARSRAVQNTSSASICPRRARAGPRLLDRSVPGTTTGELADRASEIPERPGNGLSRVNKGKDCRCRWDAVEGDRMDIYIGMRTWKTIVINGRATSLPSKDSLLSLS